VIIADDTATESDPAREFVGVNFLDAIGVHGLLLNECHKY
jgi:hypothetical protein